ncbi:HAD-IA family hydrolase [Weeksellaceae bacterium TAE3-ERU29]|nr:HAD-IA family hydrolase [Weeksellaceae bacterium TAE3-ERU29]
MMKNHFIFDMDGVLVDSEPMHQEILRLVFKKLELDISEEYLATFTGMSDIPVWTKVSNDFLPNRTPQELYEFHKKIFFQEFPSKKVEPVSGIVDFVHYLKEKGWKLSVASSSSLRMIKHFTKDLNIIDYFDFLVSGQSLERSKPFPDIFLKVAENYHLPPQEFWVLEDSYNGVKASKTAGMSCIGYQNPNSGNQDLSQADYVVNTIDKIYKILF